MTWTSAFAPATIANVGPGFDVLGFALDPAMGLGDTCDVRLVSGHGMHLTIDGDGGRLSTDPALNVATVAASRVLQLAGVETGLELRLHKGLPLGSGLGSSAASAASAASAVNAALGNPLTRAQLFDPGRAGEKAAAGFAHPDNVVPALVGGFLLMVERDDDELQVVPLPVPDQLAVALVIPDLEVRTELARKAIPAEIPVADAVSNAAHIALLVSALYDSDLDRLGYAIHDRLHQPYRTPLVPGFGDARERALAAGALGVGLSGSGPAMFAFARGLDSARACGEALAAGFIDRGTAARWVAGSVAAPFE